jgi:Concanavalin A-like lectin/glucanases superfamily
MALAIATCGAEPAPDPELEELQALLEDDPLPELAEPAVVALTQPAMRAPIGHWTFDDCSVARAELASASADLNVAYRSAGVRCVDGVLGGAIAIGARDGLVQVPDQPSFTFERGVTVAAWLRPGEVERTQTLFRKRDGGASGFALVLHRGRFEFVVELGDGHVAGVTAPVPARAGAFQHVAASYDGRALRLYVDGEQVAARHVVGTIPPGGGPLLIGNDGRERRFDGAIDEAVFDLEALTAAQIRGLTCVPAAPTVVATPDVSAPVLPDAPVTFDIAVTNHNSPACAAMDFALEAFAPRRSLALDSDPVLQERPGVASGATARFSFTAIPFDAARPGRVPIHFGVTSPAWGWVSSGTVQVDVAAPAGCHVEKSRELLITDPSVVGDPIRTSAQTGGAWSFRHLVEEAAPTPAEAPAMVEDMLRSLTAPPQVAGTAGPPRSGMRRQLDAWPRTADGRLDLARAPLQLQAIVNRIDLRDLTRGDAGQASFVFAFIEDGFQLPATLMLEYRLPAASEADVLGWAEAFHALGGIALSPSYNAALEAVTERFVRRGARPDATHGSALHAVRSNDAVLGFDWQLRSFAPLPAADQSLDPLDRGTCRDCHALAGADTAFHHIVPPFRGEVTLSSFLRGVTAADPFTGELRRFSNDLGRRADDLAAIVCPGDPARRASLRQGLRRVH